MPRVEYSHRFVLETPEVVINEPKTERSVTKSDNLNAGPNRTKLDQKTPFDYAHSDPTWKEEDHADPNIAYALLNLQLMKVRRRGMILEDKKRVAEIEAKLSSVKQDYLFSSRIASEELANRRAAMEADDLQGRLLRGAGPGQLPTLASKSKESSERSDSITSTPISGPISLGGKEDEVDEETMFGTLLDERPTEEVSPNGVVVLIKDMGLPKQWSGKTPKSLLTDAIIKMDRYATVIFKVISGGSRAVRCSCTIRWVGKKTEEWAMQTVACYDSTQAELYVATLALHAITFPIVSGFSASPQTTNSATYYRLLPPTFKTLWNELEASRRIEEDRINQSIWSNLRDMLQIKLLPKEVREILVLIISSDVNLKINQKLPKDQVHRTNRRAPHYSNATQEMSPDYIKSSLLSRQSSVAYQSMLVSDRKR
jgi:ATP-dependent RNA helicase DHX29